MRSQAQQVLATGFFPNSSRQFDAEIWIEPDINRLILKDGGSGEVLLSCPLNRARVDAAPGGGPRQVYLPDNWLLQIENTADLALFREPPPNRILRHYEALHPRLLVFVVAVLVTSFAVWRYGLSFLVALAVHMTPEPIRDAMDQGTMKTIDLLMAHESTLQEQNQAEISEIFDQVVQQVPLGEQGSRDFSLLFRDVPAMGPNAFALPGGTIVVTDALVRKFGDDADVIAGILGHEMAHSLLDHGLQELYRSLSIYVLLAMIAGDLGPVLEDIALEGQLLMRLSFSRQHEVEADRVGVHLARSAGFEGTGLARFFEKLEAQQLGAEWLSTHPSFEKRIEAIETLGAN